MNILHDILKTNDPEKSGKDKFSLSRVTFLVSFILYLIVITTGFFFAFYPEAQVEYKTLEATIDALRWPIALTAGYSFGNKTLKSVDNILGKKYQSTPK